MREPPLPAPDRVRPVLTYIRPREPEHVGDLRNMRPVVVTRTPPCSAGCPAGERVRESIALATEGHLAEAWHLVKEDNPLPAVMGRVCYHPCEDACHRGSFDQPIAIHAIERRIGDHGLTHGLRVQAAPANGMEVAVVGAGPAGLSTAYHLARRGYQVTVFDAAAQPGGMLRQGIPAYRLPRKVLDAEIEGIRALGVQFVSGVTLGRGTSWDALRAFKAVVVSTGCPVGRRLDIPGADRPGVLDGLAFLRAVNTGRGLDGAPLGRRVLVVGGGNVAVDVGRVARRLGATDVSLAFLESVDTMPAYPEERREAKAEGLRFLPGRQFLEVTAQNGRPSGVRCARIASFAFDVEGQPVVEVVPGSEHTLTADTVVIAIGQRAELNFLPPELHERWPAVARGEALRLGDQWVVSAGDVTTGPTKVVSALGGGKRAALRLDALLQGRQAPAEQRTTPIAFSALHTAYFTPAPRQELPLMEPVARLMGFAEVVQRLADDALRAEGERCFQCGDCNACGNCWAFCPDMAVQPAPGGDGANGLRRYEIDERICKGCGVCAQECPRGAILMQEEVR